MKATCTDLASIGAIGTQIGKATSDTNGADDARIYNLLIVYFDKLAGLGSKVAGEAPASIASDATTFARSVNALNGTVLRAASRGDLQRKIAASATLKAASASFTSSLRKLVAWDSANC